MPSTKDIVLALEAVATKDEDDLLFEGLASSSISFPLTSKKNAFRRIAVAKPGALLFSGPEGFKENLVHIHDENDALQPFMVAWFKSVFMLDNRSISDSDLREVPNILSYLGFGAHWQSGSVDGHGDATIKAKGRGFERRQLEGCTTHGTLTSFAGGLCPLNGRRKIRQESFVQ